MLAFKIQVDKYVGQIAYVRVYSGELKVGDSMLNTLGWVKKKECLRFFKWKQIKEMN